MCKIKQDMKELQYIRDNMKNITVVMTDDTYTKYLYIFGYIANHTWKAVAPMYRKDNILTLTDIIPVMPKCEDYDPFRTKDNPLVAVIHRVHNNFLDVELHLVDEPNNADIVILCIENTNALFAIKENYEFKGLGEHHYIIKQMPKGKVITPELIKATDEVYNFLSTTCNTIDGRSPKGREQQPIREDDRDIGIIELDKYNELSDMEKMKYMPIIINNKITD